ncbi:uncharacterized protein F5Z01DRAFT_739870 [Emericellopsis atlantica]|uniref:Uncharacterized protein n=1 Tax=Emericellopsis atlantica TaxID=2614577 RepID=A0A9P8CMC9_9HYPO|nr:uncharacterized protein F5Z01DRAFT_739870 [Emericellopsis atlantica]KAG9250561.1 hypothetical protein F5Z01DRAFT_739870 [Emericellopsis atlantica]
MAINDKISETPAHAPVAHDNDRRGCPLPRRREGPALNHIEQLGLAAGKRSTGRFYGSSTSYNYLNRNNNPQARLSTFNQDLNLKDGDCQTAVADLTAGYMLAQLSSNMLTTRVRPALYLPTAAMLWSAISAATAACTSDGSLMAVHFVLDIIGAPLFLAAVFLMWCWYTPRELACARPPSTLASSWPKPSREQWKRLEPLCDVKDGARRCLELGIV